MSHVQIFDTTLRDGEQSPGFSMNTSEKIRMAHQLSALGVDVIEAGFPIASRGDLEAVLAVAREVREIPALACLSCNQRLALAGKIAHGPRAGARSDWLDGQAGAEFRGRGGIFRRRRRPHGHRLSLS